MEEIQAHLRTRLASPEEAETVLSLWLGSARWLNAKGINHVDEETSEIFAVWE
ncbi:hypothetical protein [Paenibacillus sp. JJ-223]|uniref:hypothetical protein n=1 Tax=Paenibacillus sp. JJ-223 TaxID=2905647 RepID=UPI001F20EB85|nr:hypothetical protein [Paenibacillus sp. JJ-223]CAH1201225.1 hypothetical protein PAECIP111890_01828 [Paenibacillus sp. JJ-223]